MYLLIIQKNIIINNNVLLLIRTVLTYQGCRRAWSHVYRFVGSFSIKLFMKSFAVHLNIKVKHEKIQNIQAQNLRTIKLHWHFKASYLRSTLWTCTMPHSSCCWDKTESLGLSVERLTTKFGLIHRSLICRLEVFHRADACGVYWMPETALRVSWKTFFLSYCQHVQLLIDE